MQLDRVLVDYRECYVITQSGVQDWLKIKHVLLTTDNQSYVNTRLEQRGRSGFH